MRTKAPDRGSRATAYHEAGHAVATYFLGRAGRVKRVTIVPDPKQDTLGCMHHAGARRRFRPDIDWDGATRLRLEAEIMILLAGGIAEARATGPRAPGGCTRDDEHAADLALYAGASERQADPFLKWLEIRTEELIATRWAQVEAVAAALLRRGTLDEHALRRLLGCPSEPGGSTPKSVA